MNSPPSIQTSYEGAMLDMNINKFLDEVLRRRTSTALSRLLEGYRLSARSEGKSTNTIAIVEASVLE